MRKRPKKQWLQSWEWVDKAGQWSLASRRKWELDLLTEEPRFFPQIRACVGYRPDHPHWGVLFLNPTPPHTIKYYTTKAAAKAAATLSL